MTDRRVRRPNVAPSRAMDFHLPSHVSFGFLGERAVALDLDADRYLLIAPGEAAALASLSDHDANYHGTGCIAKFESLLRRRLIASGDGKAVAPVVADALLYSALEAAPARRRVPLVEVAGYRASAGLHLRLFGLKATVARWRRLRTRYRQRRVMDYEGEAAVSVAQAYARARVLLPARRLCVPDSFALASLLWRRGIAADVHFGVRLNPFMAHAWVQRGDLLLSDKLNTVAEYSPVFRL